ncbi:hypothetical protein ACTOWA_00505 [Herbaspirillum seropedicae]|uniref:hypothetical protein n=1 Tax=Herbaspirillum seropedicae TaxID=964 RepID=UPI00285D598D|nr:hypothetical protein [Herbaspirillum seropedicae]MDR6397926.1 hypothetical protein [Herbaspirillum seropedicae]
MSKVISLCEHRESNKSDDEWKAIEPMILALEEAFNNRPLTVDEINEGHAIERQLRMIDLGIRAKKLLLLILDSKPESSLEISEKRLKNLLEKDLRSS